MRTRVAAATAVGLFLLIGCSGDPAPSPDPLPSPLVSASPSSSPAPAALPSPKETGTKGEIERAVLAYFAAINTAFATNDTSGFPATYTDGCTACAALKKRMDDLLADGQRFQDARDEVTSLEVVEGTGNTGFASVGVRVPPYRLVDTAGKTLAEYDGSTGTLNLTVFETAEGWKVIDVADASPVTASPTP